MMTPKKSPVRHLKPLRVKKHKVKRRRIMTVRHFFGPVLEESLPVHHRMCGVPAGEETRGNEETIPPVGGYNALYQSTALSASIDPDELPKIAYRLKGKKVTI